MPTFNAQQILTTAAGLPASEATAAPYAGARPLQIGFRDDDAK
jgi:hypothetical protein